MVNLVELTLCFHTGGSDKIKNRLISKLIKWWTHGSFSHVELYFPHIRECFSASGYENRVRFKKIFFSHPSRWVFVPIGINLHNQMYENITKRAYIITGNKYDYIGAFFCNAKKRAHVERRWYCSEACAYVLGIEPSQISPQTLYDKAKGFYCAGNG